MHSPTSTNLWHGYSLADIDRLARIAATHAFGGRILDPGDRYHAAWTAIVERLCTSDEQVDGRTLAIVGMHAVSAAAQTHRHTWGMGQAGGSDGGVGGRRRFQSYWDMRQVTPSPEDSVVDRIALRQIWPRLSRTDQRALYAHVIHHGDHHEAAASLGWTFETYRTYLKKARAAYRALWHEHETPSRTWSRAGGGQRTAMESLASRRQQRARRALAAQQPAA
jgi:hypothetical protein